MRQLIFCFVFLAHSALSQKSDQEYLLDYKAGVQLYASQDFEGCIRKLTPLTASIYNNAVVPYALYYFSLASLEENKAHQTRATLRDLMLRDPDWEKIEEVYYLYALANFKDKYFDEGLNYLERIRSSELEKDSEALLMTYIPPIENIVLLKELNLKFPNQEVIAKTLVNRIQNRKYNTKADLELSDRLTNRFEMIPDKRLEGKKTDVSFKRGFDDQTIDFGVLLPFGLENFDLRAATSANRYVYDLFSGMQLALDEIKKEDIPVRLFGFDVGRSFQSVERYLKDENFKKLDLLFGPLYGTPNSLVEEYAEKNRMFQVHPISNSQALIENSESRFLIQSSNEMQSQKCLEFAESLKRAKQISVYFGAERKDSLLANIYASEAKKRGYKVNECKAFVDAESISKKQKLGHVFIAGNSTFGPKVIRALGQNFADSLVIATDESFNLETVSRNTLSKNLYLVYPQFVDLERESVKEFRKKFINKMKMIPSYYAYLGHDMLLFYSRMLKDGKEIFRLNLDESPRMDDLLLTGFDYSNKSFENKIVPIVKYSHGHFELVNLDND